MTFGVGQLPGEDRIALGGTGDGGVAQPAISAAKRRLQPRLIKARTCARRASSKPREEALGVSGCVVAVMGKTFRLEG